MVKNEKLGIVSDFLRNVKRKDLPYRLLLLIIIVVAVTSSCSRLNTVTDLVTNLSAREKYQREFGENDPAFANWQQEFDKAIMDSITVSLPYSETGNFSPVTYPVYSYEMTLDQGERLQVDIKKDSLNSLVFLDLFKQENDSVYEHFKSADFSETGISEEITASGVYKVLVQPEIGASTPFRIEISKEPVYSFPVVSKGNSAVQSYWGAVRDGGRRSHEGIDIFAKRGTPVIAVTTGVVSSTGNKGLGGKQVWLRDRDRGNSLYYAHLDSIIATPGMRVKPGDTLGLVGNTGNARTTPPHLHFGIYKGYHGAQNPLPYIYKTEKVEKPPFSRDNNSTFIISSATANLRKGPSTKAAIGGRAKAQDTLQLLGKTSDWYHTRLDDGNYFIHESLASPL